MFKTLGMRAWEVEWCEEIPYDEEAQSHDFDNATYRYRVFRDKAKAEAFAREVYPQDHFGSVSITEVEWTDPYHEDIPRTFRWEAVGEPEFYEGEN